MALRRKKREADEASFTEPSFAGEQSAAAERARLTPVDVQQKVFRLAFRGYNERDVDEFLDEVTETLAALHEENKRLREQLQDAGGGAGATAAAQRQAEAIIRQAREQAPRIGAGTTRDSAGGAAAPPASFLVRERAFLQRIASLVQDHARSLKDDARRLREVGTGPAEASAAGAGIAAGVVAGGVAAGSPGAAEAIAAEGGPSEDEPGAGADEETAVEQGSSEAAAAHSGAEASGADAGPEDAAPTATPVGAGGLAAGSPPPDEATAPWRSPQQEGAEGELTGSSTEDPLVSAWESAFASESGQADEEPAEERSAVGPENRDKDEPSLRELFWGEE